VGIAEYVRMPADKLFGDAPGNSIEIEATVFAPDLGVKNDLKQEITQFFAKVRIISRVDRRDHLVSFFKKSAAE
jgi:hypothetical protein